MSNIGLDFVDLKADYIEVLEDMAELLEIKGFNLGNEYYKGKTLDLDAYWLERHGKFDDSGLIKVRLNGELVALYEIFNLGEKGTINFKDEDSALKVQSYLNKIKEQDKSYLNKLNYMSKELIEQHG